jgi:hypothetical protein
MVIAPLSLIFFKVSCAATGAAQTAQAVRVNNSFAIRLM